jgi:hypothetical protein
MGGACSTNGGEDEYILVYWWESHKEKDHCESQDVGVYGSRMCSLQSVHVRTGSEGYRR